VTTVGIGAVAGISPEEVLAAVDAVLPAGATDVRLATLDARATEPGLSRPRPGAGGRSPVIPRRTWPACRCVLRRRR
jgi:cobalt-precorrin 5A hydrolase